MSRYVVLSFVTSAVLQLLDTRWVCVVSVGIGYGDDGPVAQDVMIEHVVAFAKERGRRIVGSCKAHVVHHVQPVGKFGIYLSIHRVAVLPVGGVA